MFSMDEKKPQSLQHIEFSSSEGISSELVKGNEIIIDQNSNEKSLNSKVKFKDLVDYYWEPKYYVGQLLAVHISGIYIAYAIKAHDKSNGIVKVINRETDEKVLLNGKFKGEIVDLSFAYIKHEIIIACVDSFGHFLVFEILEKESKLSISFLHDVDQPIEKSSLLHRVMWCPYIPDEDDMKEVAEKLAKFLLLTHDNHLEIWNIGNYKNETEKLNTDQMKIISLNVSNSSTTCHIIDIAFSPDCSAFAVATDHGEVLFYQLLFCKKDELLPSLYQWVPHNGKALSCLYFLDDLSKANSEFAITGAAGNTEIKLWSCANWECIQTVHIKHSGPTEICLKAGMDLTSHYLLLSDINHMILYIFDIHNVETQANIVCVTKIILPCSMLSFVIVGIEHKQYRLELGVLEDNQYVNNTEICLYLIQPKSLQQGKINYQPAVESIQENYNNAVTSVDLIAICEKEHTADMTAVLEKTDISKFVSPTKLNSTTLLENNMLLTPESFCPSNENCKLSYSSEIPETSLQFFHSNLPILTKSNSPESNYKFEKDEMNELNEWSVSQSSHSSPSREVQEILWKNEDKEVKENLQDIVIRNQKMSCAENNSDKCFPAPPQPPDVIHKVSPILLSNESNSKLWKLRDSSTNNITVQNTTYHNKEDAKISQNDLQSSLKDKFSNSSSYNEIEMHLKTISNQLKVLFEFFNSKQDKYHDTMHQVSTQENVYNFSYLEKCLDEHINKRDDKFNELIMTTEEIKKQQAEIVTSVKDIIFEATREVLNSLLLTGIKSEIECLRSNLLNDLIKKFCGDENFWKEMLISVFNSKVFQENWKKIAQNQILQIFKQSFTSTVIPCFESAVLAMTKQINDHFSKGVHEYVSHIEKHTEWFCGAQNPLNKLLLDRVNNFDESIKKSCEQFITQLFEECKLQMQQLYESLQDSIQSQIQQTLQQNIAKCFQQQQIVIESSVAQAFRSTNLTPLPILDSRSQVAMYISKNQIIPAFQYVLSAGNLDLLIFLCEKVNPDFLSQNPCPLQQSVLLSLIQQLSVDLTSHLELKIEYLIEAITSLDVTNSVTKEHLNIIMQRVISQLEHCINDKLSIKLSRRIRCCLALAHDLNRMPHHILDKHFINKL